MRHITVFAAALLFTGFCSIAHADSYLVPFTYTGTVLASGDDEVDTPDSMGPITFYNNLAIPATVTLNEIVYTGLGGSSYFVGTSVTVQSPEYTFQAPTYELYLHHDDCGSLNSNCVYFDFDPSDYIGPLPTQMLYLSGNQMYSFTDPGTNLLHTGFISYYGDLTLQSATTPEPSSLALLGTGLVALCATVRRRFA